ncbi:MAG: STAS domain-containing protein [bacterium]
MTEVKKVFQDVNGDPVGEIVAKIEFVAEQKHIALRLSGIIIGDNAEALRDFVKNVSCFPAHIWTLHLERLSTISVKGMQALAKLARILQRRGCELEIKDANAIILAILSETNYLDSFKLGIKPKKHKISDRRVLQVDPGEPVG